VGGKELLAKGHMISKGDTHVLEIEVRGMGYRVEEGGEISEDEAAMEVASEIGCGSLSIRLAAGGRRTPSRLGECCVLVDGRRLAQFFQRRP
jgi:hypothetical protein